MSRQLHISKELSLPIDAATQTFALIGRKGGGKTYCAGKLAELFIGAGVHTIILDLVGKWWGLRLAADGRSPGIDIPMFGGLRGDIPLEPSGGALLAEALHESGSNAILDLSQFSKAGRQEFCYRFGERLWRLKKSELNPTPIHLMIEESQLIVPENIPTGSKHDFMTLMYGTFEEIIRLGRNYGIGITMITQRPQSVAKEVLNQSEPLLVFQLIGAHERKAIKLWIQHQGLDESLLDTLPSLTKGECWFWSPEWLQTLERIHIGEKWTFDSTATPKVGEKHVKAREIKSLDLSDLRQRMKETIERQKQDDPKELRKTIGELRGQIKKIESAKPQTVTETKTKTEIKTVEKRIMAAQSINRLEGLLEKASAIPVIVEEIRAAIREGKELNAANMIASPVAKSAPPARAVGPAGGSYAKHIVKREPKAIAATNGDFRASSSQQRILDSLAWAESIGLSEMPKTQLALMADQSPTSGGYFNNLGSLRTAGMLDYPSAGNVTLTDSGRGHANTGNVPTTNDELHNQICAKLSGSQQTILRELIAAHPGAIKKDELAGRVGQSPTSGGFFNNLGRLRSLKLIDYPQAGYAVATSILFIE